MSETNLLDKLCNACVFSRQDIELKILTKYYEISNASLMRIEKRAELTFVILFILLVFFVVPCFRRLRHPRSSHVCGGRLDEQRV